MTNTDHLHMPQEHMEALYASSNPMVRWVFQQRLNTLCKLLTETNPQTVLDAGCGEGHLLERLQTLLPHAHLQGADALAVPLAQAHLRAKRATLVESPLETLPFVSETFDAVVCTEVIEHVVEPARVLAELWRVLKPGGTLIVTFPNETNWTIARFLLGRRPIRVPDHLHAHTPRHIQSLVGVPPVRRLQLPLRLLPFVCSLGCVMVFKKM